MGKKVLLISYHFPPSAEVGGLRIANFAGRLPRFGWTPYVLTVEDRFLQSVDLERLTQLEGIRIFKAGRTPSVSQAYLACKKAVRRLLQRPSATLANSHGGRPVVSRPGRNSETLAMRLRRYVLSFLSLPDSQRTWIGPAVLEAVRAIRREDIACILTSCPPYSAHLVGLLVKWITGVPLWIADFRDPWMTAGSKSLYATCAASLSIEARMERAVVRNADRIILNTEALCVDFKKAYAAIPGDRFVCITNGFDREFFGKYTHLEKEKRFTIIYAGSFYFGRTPEPIFQAIQELIREGAVEKSAFCVRLIGHCRSVGGRPIDEMIQRYGLGEVVEVLEPVSYSRAIEMITRSHLALLLAPNQPHQIPAKLYDYMGAGTRVLAIAKEGATADLIRRAEIGAVFESADVAGIRRFIAQAFTDRGTAERETSHEATKQFELDSIANRLADELDHLYVSRSSGAPASVSSLPPVRD